MLLSNLHYASGGLALSRDTGRKIAHAVLSAYKREISKLSLKLNQLINPTGWVDIFIK